jgi:peptide/nickel transport system ATP-binding protein
MSRLLTIKDLVIEGFQQDAWQKIVRGVSLHLDRGEVLGLIGESGAGKSTLGMAGMGYTRAGCRIVSGSIEFDGIELTTASDEKLRGLRGARIAYVAQSAAAFFNPAHKLSAQLMETGTEHGLMGSREAAAKVKELYRQLCLPDPDHIGSRYPHQVSGGQLQRAMVAMSMVCSPELIVFDEPTTALDVTTQIEVLGTIRDAIRQLGTSAIYISHDLAVVSQIADRIMVLRHGELVEEGPTRGLIANPKEPYTRALLSVRKTRTERARAPEGEAPLLDIDGISASYANAIRVLDQVSTTVNPGETVAVVGESGSGKSTLARTIVGLLPPSAGELRFRGERLPAGYRERSKDLLRRIQIIYQMPDVALNPRQMVGDIIGRPLAFYFGMDRVRRHERVIELLAMTELGPEYANRFPSEISGGEKQRVCIARALAADPELIICDEITSALDQLVADGILKLLQRLQATLGVSYLFITHDLATVRAIADKIIIMHRGQIVEQGTRDDVLAPPHHDYTELLLSSVPEMDPDWLPRILDRRRNIRSSISGGQKHSSVQRRGLGH